MARLVRLTVPVNPDAMETAAQAMFDALQAQLHGAAQPPAGDAGAHWTAEERDKLRRGEIPGGFAGPHETFPIGSADDVRTAWAPAPPAVRREIRAIAQRCGWQDALPPED